jgi:ABC-type transport system involved in multi-copper enzyme maturation permease subunit
MARAQKWFQEQHWQLWGSQVFILVRNEVRRNLFTRRRFWIYLLAFVPVLIIAAQKLFEGSATETWLEGDTRVLAGTIQFYYIRLGIFFACMGIFAGLFRAEVVEHTLHYQFLVPVRREVLVIGKFLGGAIIAIVVFETAILASFYLIYSRFGSVGRAYVFGGPGLGQLGSYLLVTALACLGYGSVFLALSLIFKNPIVPGALLMGWETIIPVFPAWAQRLSVTFYLKHLCPVSVPIEGPMAIFTVVAEPVSPVAAVMGLLCFTVAILVLSCFLIHRLEISYGTE